jgi:uncharacterized protein
VHIPTQRLIVNNVDVASVEIAATRVAQRTGLLGRDGLGSGAMWFPKVKSVHTIRMRFPLDVAFLDNAATVCKVVMMKPGRIGGWVPKAAGVLEAEAGMFATWNLQVGSTVTFGPIGQVDEFGNPHAG